ncbi:MAG: hypothetical protein EBX52_03440 [Proteobacteria bacterium]|nr:hypothetical protein [Pseudomonadota bacterium]
MSGTPDFSFFGLYEDLILTRNGVWLSNGEEITHEKTMLAFSRNLYRCKDGFEIRIGSERKTVHVEDTLYFVTGIEGDPAIGYTLRLNDGRLVNLEPETLRYGPGRLTCSVSHPNEGTHEEARFLSPAYYGILNHLESDPDGFRITIEGKTIRFKEPR